MGLLDAGRKAQGNIRKEKRRKWRRDQENVKMRFAVGQRKIVLPVIYPCVEYL